MNRFRRKLTILLLMIFVLSNSSFVIASVLKSPNYEFVDEETESETEIQAVVSKSNISQFKEIHGSSVTKISCHKALSVLAVPRFSKVISKKYIMFRAILI